MKVTRLSIPAIIAVAVMSATVGTVHAQPVITPFQEAPADATALPGIHWEAEIVGRSVALRTDIGSLVAKDDQFQVVDPNGIVVAGFPLSYFMDGAQYPISAEIQGNEAILTPIMDPAAARTAEMPIKHVDAQTDMALGAAATQFGLASGVGSLIGTIIGLVGGCVLGALTVGALTAPIFFAGAPGGCIMGASIGVALGAAAGVIALGLPVGIAAAIQFFQTINAPAPAPAI